MLEDEVWQVIFGAGAVSALASGLITEWQRRRSEWSYWLRDARLHAYAVYLEAVDRHLLKAVTAGTGYLDVDTSRELGEVAAEVQGRVRRDVDTAFGDLLSAQSQVALLGGARTVEAAKRLTRTVLTLWRDVLPKVSEHLTGRPAPVSVDVDEEPVDEATRREMRDEFLEAAREELESRRVRALGRVAKDAEI